MSDEPISTIAEELRRIRLLVENYMFKKHAEVHEAYVADCEVLRMGYRSDLDE